MTAARAKILALLAELGESVADPEPRPFVPGQHRHPGLRARSSAQPEIAAMVEASLDGWLTTGRFNAAFEERLANFLGVKHVLTVNSGSSANLVAFSALTSPRLGERAIQPGRRGHRASRPASRPPSTRSCSSARCRSSSTCDLPTYNIDASQLEAAICPAGPRPSCSPTPWATRSTWTAVARLLRPHHLWLIEDCCDALGCHLPGPAVGTVRRHRHPVASTPPTTSPWAKAAPSSPATASSLKLMAESFRDWGRDCYCDARP